MNDTDARLWHPWLRINRVLRVVLHTRWCPEAWSQVRVEFRKALALRSEIRRAGCGGVSALQGDLPRQGTRNHDQVDAQRPSCCRRGDRDSPRARPELHAELQTQNDGTIVIEKTK
jgi:hypothetical protein